MEFMRDTLQDAIEHNVSAALAEDIDSGDLTALLIPPAQPATATIISRGAAVICGIPWVERCFQQIAPETQIDWQIAEGDSVQPGQLLCEINGNARALLT